LVTTNDIERIRNEWTTTKAAMALLLNPNLTPAYTMRGLAFEQRGELARARADYNDALTHPRSSLMTSKWAVDVARQRLAGTSAAQTVPTSVPSPLVTAIGGIAVGTCDRIGWATGFDNVDAARSTILETCAKDGDKACRIVLPVVGNCAAFVMAGTCGPRGWASGADRRQAEEQALRNCEEHGGRDCTVRRSICDGED
jgi:hypothetical protein